MYLFAGDIGAFSKHLPMYYKDENVVFIASGMGGGKNDNYIISNVYKDVHHTVDFDLIWLQNCNSVTHLENIEDYTP